MAKYGIFVRQHYFDKNYALIRKTKNGESLIADNFKNLDTARDYARLYAFTERFKPEYSFTPEEKDKLCEIASYVESQYCMWVAFVETVIHDSQGLSGLLNMIHENKTAKEIADKYI